MRTKGCSFHPLKDSDLLNQLGSDLKNYKVEDRSSRESYVAQRLLHVVLLTYMKHHQENDEAIGWNELCDKLHDAICEAIGDDEFCKWSDSTSKG